MVSVLLSVSFKDSIYNNRWQKTAELHAALKSDEQREREWKESRDKKKTFFCELWGTLSVNFRIPSSGYIQHKSHYHSTMVSFPQLIESFVKNCGGNAFLLPVIFVSYLSCHQIETESPLISLILYCSHKMNAFLAGSEFQRNNVSYGLFVIMESDFRSPVPQSYAGPWQPPAPVAPCSRQRWVFLTAAHGDPEHSAALLESGTPSRADGCSEHTATAKRKCSQTETTQLLLLIDGADPSARQPSREHLMPETKWWFPFSLWYSLQKERVAQGTTLLPAAAWVKATPPHIS